MAGMLSRAGAGLTLVHHPASNGLSPFDLVQLEKPGVHAVVAIGHDGGVYVVARGASDDAFDRGAGFLSRVRRAARAAVGK